MILLNIYRYAVVLIACLVLLTSCKKDNMYSGMASADLKRVVRTPEGRLVIQNNSPSQIRVSLNNVTRAKLINAGTADTIQGVPSSTASIVVETVVTDVHGNPAGQQLVFQYNVKFPAENEYSKKEINIPPNLFFINVLNLSPVPATKLVVSAGGPDDMISYMAITNSKNMVPCGYYPANSLFANITVIAGNDNIHQWSFTGLTLPGLSNQSIAVTCQ